jgi:aminoglycoside phosphotransferase (APT) family kinase protein
MVTIKVLRLVLQNGMAPIWIHGDFAIGNILMDAGKLSAVIDFGGAAVGDSACDLVRHIDHTLFQFS